ncbi:MAG: hypothetical protein L0219_16995, partial [Phycisphaerales bacterium]|nr:hypothetical protein [Phycisphaerales bacterium]
GPKAIRSVGQFVKEHGAAVTAIYTSNVEQYLFQQSDDWKKYYSNVATLPIDSTSTFIRAVFNMGLGYPSGYAGMRSQTLLCPVADLVQAFSDGKIAGYRDVVWMGSNRVR